MPVFRILAVAINHKRLGYVFFQGYELKEWQAMTKPVTSRAEAAGALQRLINDFKPNVVITEQADPTTCRSKSVLALKNALSRTAAHNYVLDVAIKRDCAFANRYEEASALADFYPAIRPWVPPKRRAFDHQPPRLILFDALALAHKVLQKPTITLAAAMS